MTLEIDGVSKTLGTFSLRDVSLRVGAGEYFVLLGPTGAGKTVLLEVTMGFHRPDRGTILLDDRDITNVPTDKRRIAYVPQDCPLFPHMTVFENVEFGLKMQRVASSERKKIANRVLETMSLNKFAESMPSTLSGGERRKVVLARVLATDPKVVLLDEPLTSIDAQTSRSLRGELKRINREFGVAFLHVTHDQIEAFSLADKIAVMKEGEIMQTGVPAEVFSNPTNEFTARFLGYDNVFQVRLVKHDGGRSVVSVDSASFRLDGKLETDSAMVALRPEDITVTVEAPVVSEEWNLFEGKLAESVGLGPFVELTVEAGFALKAFVNRRSFLEMSMSRGKRVYAAFKTDSVKIVQSTEARDSLSGH